eukprot:gene9046-17149_t
MSKNKSKLKITGYPAAPWCLVGPAGKKASGSQRGALKKWSNGKAAASQSSLNKVQNKINNKTRVVMCGPKVYLADLRKRFDAMRLEFLVDDIHTCDVKDFTYVQIKQPSVEEVIFLDESDVVEGRSCAEGSGPQAYLADLRKRFDAMRLSFLVDDTEITYVKTEQPSAEQVTIVEAQQPVCDEPATLLDVIDETRPYSKADVEQFGRELGVSSRVSWASETCEYMDSEQDYSSSDDSEGMKVKYGVDVRDLTGQEISTVAHGGGLTYAECVGENTFGSLLDDMECGQILRATAVPVKRVLKAKSGIGYMGNDDVKNGSGEHMASVNKQYYEELSMEFLGPRLEPSFYNLQSKKMQFDISDGVVCDSIAQQRRRHRSPPPLPKQQVKQVMVRSMFGYTIVVDVMDFDICGPMSQIAEYLAAKEGHIVERLSFHGKDVNLNLSIREYLSKGMSHGSRLEILPRRRGGGDEGADEMDDDFLAEMAAAFTAQVNVAVPIGEAGGPGDVGNAMMDAGPPRQVGIPEWTMSYPGVADMQLRVKITPGNPLRRAKVELSKRYQIGPVGNRSWKEMFPVPHELFFEPRPGEIQQANASKRKFGWLARKVADDDEWNFFNAAVLGVKPFEGTLNGMETALVPQYAGLPDERVIGHILRQQVSRVAPQNIFAFCDIVGVTSEGIPLRANDPRNMITCEGSAFLYAPFQDTSKGQMSQTAVSGFIMNALDNNPRLSSVFFVMQAPEYSDADVNLQATLALGKLQVR